jgi:hypothetical protein
LRIWCERNRAQHLPARAGQSEIGHKAVAGREQLPVETEHRKHETGQGFAAGRMSFGCHY